jgi:hypothetical protein
MKQEGGAAVHIDNPDHAIQPHTNPHEHPEALLG